MWITRVSINNPVFAAMVMVALCVLGMVWLATLAALASTFAADACAASVGVAAAACASAALAAAALALVGQALSRYEKGQLVLALCFGLAQW